MCTSMTAADISVQGADDTINQMQQKYFTY